MKKVVGVVSALLLFVLACTAYYSRQGSILGGLHYSGSFIHREMTRLLFKEGDWGKVEALALSEAEYPDLYRFKETILVPGTEAGGDWPNNWGCSVADCRVAKEEDAHYAPGISGPNKSILYWMGNEGLWEIRMLSSHAQGRISEAYTELGYIVHLTEDNTVPAHGRVIFHGPDYYYDYLSLGVVLGQYLDDDSETIAPRKDNFETEASYRNAGDLIPISPADYFRLLDQTRQPGFPCIEFRKFWLRREEFTSPLERYGWGAYGIRSTLTCGDPDSQHDEDWYSDDSDPNLTLARKGMYAALRLASDAMQRYSKMFPPLVSVPTGTISVDFSAGPASSDIAIQENRTQNVTVTVTHRGTGQAVRGTLLPCPGPACLQTISQLVKPLYWQNDSAKLPWGATPTLQWDGTLADGSRVPSGQQFLDIVVTDADGNRAVKTVALNIGAPASTLTVSPGLAWGFGNILVGASLSQIFTLGNGGSVSLRVASLALSGTDVGQFSLNSPDLPFDIAPGAPQDVTVTFQPTSAGVKTAALIITYGGTLTQAVSLRGSGIATTGNAVGIISTVAGNGTAGFSGDGGSATSASLYYPWGVAVDAAGNLYIADSQNWRVRRVDLSGAISTVAGNGTWGFSGDGGSATSASLYFYVDLAVDGVGNLYIAGDQDSRIRRVDPSGTISTVAGASTSQGFSGDGGPATAALLNFPSGVAVDAAGNLYIADSNNNRIRRVTADGTISTVAGNGTAGFSGDGGPATNASLHQPQRVAADTNGNLYVADWWNHRIRRVDPNGTISTVAGNGTSGYSGDGGSATSASLQYPMGVAVDAAGNLYIADSRNNRIRRVTANGVISTVAGNGIAGFSGDGGPAASASLNTYPNGVAVGSAGDLYIADTGNNRVRKVSFAASSSTLPQLGAMAPSSVVAGGTGFTLTVSGTGFVQGATLRWTGSNRVTNVVSATQLTATITAADIATPGTAQVSVYNPPPGGGVSNSLTFSITPAAMLLFGTLAPDSVSLVPGGTAQTLSVTLWRMNLTAPVTLAVGGLPTGVTAAIGQPRTGNSATITLQATSTAAPSLLRSITVTATASGVPPATAAFGLAVVAPSVVSGSITAGAAQGWPGATARVPIVLALNSGASVDALSAALMVAPNGGAPPLTGRLSFQAATGVPPPTYADTGGAANTLSLAWLNLPTLLTGTVKLGEVVLAVPGSAVSGQTYALKILGSAAGLGANAVQLTPGADATLTIGSDPLPTVASLLPASVVAGAPSFTLTVKGSGFAAGSVVRWNGSDRQTTFISDTQLQAAITAADVAAAGSAQVAVFTPAPGGGVSGALTFTIAATNPAPAISALAPAAGIAGSADFPLTINGSGLVFGSVARWNGANLATTFINSTQLAAQVPAANAAAAATAQITVFNPAPGGGLSAAVSFPVNNPSPVVTLLAPASTLTGAAAFTLTVNGFGFVPGSVVRWNTTDRTTTFVSSNQLTITISTADVASAGTGQVAVFSPAPGGGASSTVSFPILATNPAPTVASLSPASGMAGGPAFVLTVTGTNFLPASTVRWNGADRATTFLSSTMLAASISAADVAAPATAQISVFNPEPGGGASASLAFVISAPGPTAIVKVSGDSQTKAVTTATDPLVVQVNNQAGGAIGGVTVNFTLTAGSATLSAASAITSSTGQAQTGVTMGTVAGPVSVRASVAGVAQPAVFSLTAAAGPPASLSIVSGNSQTGMAGSTLVNPLAVKVSDAFGNAASGVTVNFVPSGGSVSAASVTTSANGQAQVAWTLPSAAGAVTLTASVAALPGVTFAATVSPPATGQGTITVGQAQGAPGGIARVPITLALNSGVTVDGLAFGVAVTPSGLSPVLTNRLSFNKGASMPQPTQIDTGAAANLMSVSWLGMTVALSGTVTLGEVAVMIPASAVDGQSYGVRITGASASLGNTAVPLLTAADSSLQVSTRTYLVGDVFPMVSSSGDLNADGDTYDAGEFGDEQLTILDLIYALRAVTSVPGYRPPACSDRFDAIDSFPKDTDTARGGDGILNTVDLIYTLRRVTNVDTSRPRRTSRGLACPAQAPGQEIESMRVRRPIKDAARAPTADLQAEVLLELGTPQPTEGGVRVGVYLHAAPELNLAGFSFAAGLAERGPAASLRFVAADAGSPSLIDGDLPGVVAVAWLDGLRLPAGRPVLLGYLEMPAGQANASLRFYGASANTSDGGEIRLTLSAPPSGHTSR
jgi:sugar lactone lactonase YvrE